MDVEDRLGILEVQSLYGHVLDRGLWSRLGEVFAPDGVFDPSDVGLPPMRGLEAIRERLIPLEDANPRRCHHSTNVVIQAAQGNTAQVLSKYICEHPTGIISFGEYEDAMVRTAGGWRIAHRRTRRRALGREEGAGAGFTLDWDALLANAAPRPPLGLDPAPPSLTVQDRIELLDLQGLYGHVLDRGLWDRIGEVFAADGVFDPSDVGLPPMRGLDEIREKLIPLEEGAGPTRCHHSTNAVILDAGSGRARMLSKYLCSAGAAAISYGEYEDDLVRTPAGWRIALRRTRRRAQGIEQPSGGFSIDWKALLAAAPSRPALAPPRPPLPLDIRDRLDIADLLAFYGHLFDRYWGDRLDEIFTADAVFDPSSIGGSTLDGLEAIRRRLFTIDDAHPRDTRRAHHGSNVTILDATPDSALVLSKYVVRHPTAAIAFGEYEDDLARTPRGWRIRRRKTFRRALGLAPA
ncbi:MAG: nuclear transport factor 2 family protein [Gammaproteobacteria bacterium]